jgi:hypothetical protein
MAKKRIDPMELYPHTALVQSQHYNFGERHEFDDWEIPFKLTDEERENEEFQPMMNYLYPLEDFERRKTRFSDKELKKALDEAGSVTLIRRNDDGEYYLALSGGGMDLSWDICAAYVNLSYLPPFTFCEELPEYSGEKYNDAKHQNVIFACQRSVSFVEARAKRAQQELQKFVDKVYANKWKWEPDRR